MAGDRLWRGCGADIVSGEYHSGLVQHSSHIGPDPGGSNCHENLWDNREEKGKEKQWK